MITAQRIHNENFYREFLMKRGSFEPSDFGIDMAKENFIDQMVDEFHGEFRSVLSVDELLLRPQVAMDFCAKVRLKYGYYDLPDDIILRSILHRRKNP